MPRLQDLPDISKTITKDDKVVIVRPTDQGLTSIEKLQPYVKPVVDDESEN